jgi:hypothetical protein
MKWLEMIIIAGLLALLCFAAADAYKRLPYYLDWVGYTFPVGT